MTRGFAAVTASVPSAPMLIGLQGDSGIGKTTLGVDLAERLGVPWYDVGMVFRALAEVIRRQGINPSDKAACTAMAQQCRFELKDGMVVVICGGGEYWVNQRALRSKWVNENVSVLTQNLGFWAAVTYLVRGWVDRTEPGVVIGRHMHAIFEMGLVLDVSRDAAESRELRGAQEGSAAAVSLAERNRLDRETADALGVQGPVEFLDITGCSPEEQLERVLELVAKAGFDIPA
jgi:cytidylate kinase